MELGAMEVILALLTSVVGSLVWVVKSVLTAQMRSQRVRDEHIGTLIESLQEAVGHFQGFEQEEQETHELIVERLKAIEHEEKEQGLVLQQVAVALEGITARLEARTE